MPEAKPEPRTRQMINAVHLIDDGAVGGVTTALKNFTDKRLTAFCDSTIDVVETGTGIARRYHHDLIILHLTMSWAKIPYLISLRALHRKTAIVIVEHSYTAGFERHNVTHKKRFRLLLRLVYSLCDRVVAVSEGQARWLASFVGAGKLAVIPQSRRMETFRNLERRDDGRQPTLKFGAIGRFHRQKGFDLLIEAFKSVARKDATLTIAGYGEDEASLKASAEGVDGISFVGLIKDPASFYQAVDVVIIPSRWEAFGLVASEAIAAGCGVIVADSDGLPEQVPDAYQNDGDVIVAGDSISTLGAAIAAMCEKNRDILPTETMRDEACKRFDHLIEHWAQLIDEVASAKRSSRYGRSVRQPGEAIVLVK